MLYEEKAGTGRVEEDALTEDLSGDREFQRFKAAAEEGNLVPLYERLLSDQLTPVLAYRCLVTEDDREAPSFLFESVVNGDQQVVPFLPSLTFFLLKFSSKVLHTPRALSSCCRSTSSKLLSLLHLRPPLQGLMFLFAHARGCQGSGGFGSGPGGRGEGRKLRIGWESCKLLLVGVDVKYGSR